MSGYESSPLSDCVPSYFPEFQRVGLDMIKAAFSAGSPMPITSSKRSREHVPQIRAVSIGHALDVDRAGFGAVHSVFDRAVNVTMRGELWTLLAQEKSDLPFGLRLGVSSFATHGLRRGDPVHVRSGYVAIGARLVVDCRAAPRWVPAFEGKLVEGLQDRLAVVAAAALGRSWHESAPMARAVRTAVGGATPLGTVLAGVVGCGPGATPAGDDVLVGALAVVTSPHAGREGARATEALARALLPLLPTTTDVSGYLLRQAASGQIGRDLHELVAVLVGARAPQELNGKVQQVIATGATSGADACAGLLAFAPDYFAYGNDWASA